MVSVEIYPPNNVATLAGLRELKTPLVNIAFKKDFEVLRKTVADLQEDSQLTAELEPHIIGSKFTKSDIAYMVSGLHQLGIRKLLACRGDGRISGDFPNSLPLTRFIMQEFPDIAVSATIYPEPYDWNMLQRKHELGVRDYICQMSFDNVQLFKLNEKFDKLLPESRLHVGVMVLAKKANVNMVVENNWVEVPAAIRHLTADAIHSHGPEITLQQIDTLTQHGIENIHLYTWNNWAATQEVLNALALN